ncbi:MAG: hypothetical protein CMM80_06335 [Rhodospirillaceae bacterium]|nr:hypothetical protein [Rhodospirillaceae bacterium]
MIKIQPRFFESENKILAHLEWEAKEIVIFDGSYVDIADANPNFEPRKILWIDPFNDKASKQHHQIKRKYLKVSTFTWPTKEALREARKSFLKNIQIGFVFAST